VNPDGRIDSMRGMSRAPGEHLFREKCRRVGVGLGGETKCLVTPLSVIRSLLGVYYTLYNWGDESGDQISDPDWKD